MNFVVRSISIAAAVSLMLVSPAHAQSSADAIVKSAKSGNWYVRITTTDQRTVEGRVTLIDRDTVLLTRTSVAIPEIAALDRRVRVGGGAVPGAAAGAAAMGFLGYGVVSALCESSNCDVKAVAGLAGGAAMGATVGAVLGAMLAPGRVEWRRMYPHADSLRDALQRDTRQRADTLPSFSGAAFTVGTGLGTVQDIGDQQGTTAFRFALQLSATTRAERPIETTAEANALLGTRGGGILGADVGANLVSRRGDYVGALIGIGDAAGGRAYAAGLRVGHRPHHNIGIRPEGRAKLFWNGDGSAMEFSVSLSLESR